MSNFSFLVGGILSRASRRLACAPRDREEEFEEGTLFSLRIFSRGIDVGVFQRACQRRGWSLRTRTTRLSS